MIVVLMGAMGSGKTTIGKQLADRLGVIFADADDYHSAENKAKMAAGTALNDQDRQPWLETLNGVMHGWQSAHAGGVLACSALKEKYRQTLNAGMPAGSVHFVLLNVTKAVLTDRLAHRHHQFMNQNLLTSQLETLEMPENALIVPSDGPPDQIVNEILQRLS